MCEGELLNSPQGKAPKMFRISKYFTDLGCNWRWSSTLRGASPPVIWSEMEDTFPLTFLNVPSSLVELVSVEWGAVCQVWDVCMLGVYQGVVDAISGVQSQTVLSVRGKWANWLKINPEHAIPLRRLPIPTRSTHHELWYMTWRDLDCGLF